MIVDDLYDDIIDGDKNDASVQTQIALDDSVSTESVVFSRRKN